MYYYIISLSIFLSFISPPTTSTTKICAEEDECRGENIICSSRETCNVHCSASNACNGAIIECGSGQQCHVHCVYHGEDAISTSGLNICQNMQIYAEDSTLLIVNASVVNQATFQYPRTLETAKIHCPVNTDNGEKPCQILCDGDDLMQQTTIYATNGMNDVSIVAKQYLKRWCIRGTKLSCDATGDSQCTLTNQPPFECNGDISSTELCTGTPAEPTPPPIDDTETAAPTPETATTEQPTMAPTADGETAIPTAAPINIFGINTTMNDGMGGDDGAKGSVDRETDSGLMAGVMIPLFILSILGFCCGMYIMKRRGTWFTKEEYAARKSGQHKRINERDEDQNGYNIKEVYDDDIEEQEEEDDPLRTGDVNDRRQKKEY